MKSSHVYTQEFLYVKIFALQVVSKLLVLESSGWPAVRN